MRYQGSAAYSMETAERGQERLDERSARSFEVVSGGGLDARAREGVSPQFVGRVRAILVAAAVLVTLGMARVGISAATVTCLRSSVELGTQIEAAESLNDQLRAQSSALSSNARISRIATQNYGMVPSSSSVTLDLSAGEEGAEAAADGDAAQSESPAQEQSNLS